MGESWDDNVDPHKENIKSNTIYAPKASKTTKRTHSRSPNLVQNRDQQNSFRIPSNHDPPNYKNMKKHKQKWRKESHPNNKNMKNLIRPIANEVHHIPKPTDPKSIKTPKTKHDPLHNFVKTTWIHITKGEKNHQKSQNPDRDAGIDDK